MKAPDQTKKRRKNKKLNKQGQVIKQQVMMSIERKRVAKYVDLGLLTDNSTTTVGYQIISLIPQGDAQSQRVADTVYLDRLDIRMNAYMLETTTDFTNYIRWGFFMWKPNTQTYTPTALTIFQNPTSYSINSPLTFETRDDYSMLADMHTKLTGYVGVPTAASQQIYDFSINLKNHRIQFNIGLGTGTGHIYFVNFSDSSTSPFPQYNLVTRLWYYDAD